VGEDDGAHGGGGVFCAGGVCGGGWC
jgi:hypothetical protein